MDQTCSSPESPCVHNPTTDPEHCEYGPPCEGDGADVCTLGTPHASQVDRPEVALAAYGRGHHATPLGCFGRDYYCTTGPEGMNWPEACAEGKRCGPVAPLGHPQRVACERVFLGADCPVWRGECTAPIEPPRTCPITFDILIGDDPHFMNRACPAPVGNHVERPIVYWARGEGRGKIFACAQNPDGTLIACTNRPKRIDQ